MAARLPHHIQHKTIKSETDRPSTSVVEWLLQLVVLYAASQIVVRRRGLSDIDPVGASKMQTSRPPQLRIISPDPRISFNYVDIVYSIRLLFTLLSAGLLCTSSFFVYTNVTLFLSQETWPAVGNAWRCPRNRQHIIHSRLLFIFIRTTTYYT